MGVATCVSPRSRGRERGGLRQQLYPLGSAVASRLKRSLTETFSRASIIIRLIWDSSAQAQ